LHSQARNPFIQTHTGAKKQLNEQDLKKPFNRQAKAEVIARYR